MKRWLINSVIAVYLSAMGFGIFSHMLSFHNTTHPVMYFFVWDMFCGWSGYENRIHIVGEGESGAYYDLSKGPWGEFNPFSDIGRRHYDYNAVNLRHIPENVLRNTQHEPMTRIFVFEENWAKKYNMPDYIWNQMWEEPKVPRSYYSVRQVLTPESELAQVNNCWLTQCCNSDFMSNPRLRQEARLVNPSISVAKLKRKEPERTASRPDQRETFLDGQREPENLFTPAGN